jgi:hypothetical protein
MKKLHGPMRSKEREKGGWGGTLNPYLGQSGFLGRPGKKLDNPLGNLAK